VLLVESFDLHPSNQYILVRVIPNRFRFAKMCLCQVSLLSSCRPRYLTSSSWGSCTLFIWTGRRHVSFHERGFMSRNIEWKLSGCIVGEWIAQVKITWIKAVANISILNWQTRDQFIKFPGIRCMGLMQSTHHNVHFHLTTITYHTWFDFTRSTRAGGRGRKKAIARRRTSGSTSATRSAVNSHK
jgi:hypothetical protein